MHASDSQCFCPILSHSLTRPTHYRRLALSARTSPVKVTHPLAVCYTPGLRHRLSGGGHHAEQSVRTFCEEKSDLCDGAWHAGTRPGRGATRYLVCPDRPEAVHAYRVVFDRL